GRAGAMRAQPTRRGLGVPSLASRAITDPVVPQDTAARETRTSPRSIAPVVYGREAPRSCTRAKRRMSVETIGFIGVGTMGLPMAANLLKKGFAVTAYNLNPEAVKAAAAAGMTAAASAAEAVAGADLVITMLPSSPHVEAAYTGDGGVVNAARKGTLCIDMSTIAPAASRPERGIRFIDAPVSGGTPRATDGTLAIMVGGSAEDFKAALPALMAM